MMQLSMMLPAVLAWSWTRIFWNVMGFFLVFICLAMILVILIQDSKGAGLTSAFGAGPGGESLLGARMQKDVARWTAYLGIVFTVLVLAMGLLGTYEARGGSAGMTGAGTPKAEITVPGEGGEAPGAGGAAPTGAVPGQTAPVPPAGQAPPAGKQEGGGAVPPAPKS